MPNWKKVVTSGSNAELNHISASIISASNHISSSDIIINKWGSVSASLASLGSGTQGLQEVTDVGSVTTNDVSITGDLYVNKLRRANEVTDETKITFSNDQIDFHAGNTHMLRMESVGQDTIVFNEGSGDVDFRIESNDKLSTFFIDGEFNKVYIGYNEEFPGSVSDTAALNISGSINLVNNGDISMPGISSLSTEITRLGTFVTSSNGTGFNNIESSGKKPLAFFVGTSGRQIEGAGQEMYYDTSDNVLYVEGLEFINNGDPTVDDPGKRLAYQQGGFVSASAGSGLKGGGITTQSFEFNIGQGNGINVYANGIELRNFSSSAVSSSNWDYLMNMDQDVNSTGEPQFKKIQLGHASDTTLTRPSAGKLAVEGNTLLRQTGDGIVSSSAITDGTLNVDFATIKGNNLSSGKVVFAGTDGQLITDSNFSWSAGHDRLTITNGSIVTPLITASNGIQVSGDILPTSDNTLSLGSTTQRFQLNGGTPVTVGGSGTANQMTRFSAATEVENSTIENTDTLTTIRHTNDTNDIFIVSGSNGQLLKVTDEIGEQLLQVNDGSGITHFEVSSSGTLVAQNLTYNNETFILTYNSASGDISFFSSSAITGDDLGNHTATQDLNMGTNNITNVGNVDGVDVSQLQTDFNTLNGKSLVSSSAQIDHDQLTNFNSNEHFTQANITTVGTVTSGDVSAILPDGTVSGSAQIDGASISSNTVSYGGVSLALGGTDATPAFNLSDATAYPGDSSLTTLGTVTTGDVSAILPDGTVSGSSQISIGSTDGAGNVVGLDVGIDNLNVLQANTNVSDNDFLRVDGSKIEGRTASQVKSDIGLGNVENTAISTFGGSSNITTIGTVTTGDVSAILPDGTISSSAQIDHDATTNFNSNEHFTQANITTVGTVTTGDVSAILPNGVVSGSVTSPSQGTLSVNGNNVDLGLQVGDSPTFTNLTLSGNLTVEGSRTELQVTELNVQDKNITVASGAANSSAADGAGLTIDGANESLTWNHANSRFQFSDDLKVDGLLNIGSVSNAGTDTDKFLVLDSNGNVDFRTGTEVRSDIGAGTSNYGDSDVTDHINTLGVVSGSSQISIGSTDGAGNVVGLDVGIDNLNVLQANTNVADDDFLRVDGTKIEGRTASQVKSDIGLGNVENTAISTFGGSSNITTIGTVTSGDVSAILPDGTISSSAQIDHDATTNFVAAEHFTQASITTVGTVTTGDVSAILPNGVVSGSSQISIGSTNGAGNVVGLDVGIDNLDVLQSEGVSDDDFLRVNGVKIEGRTASQVKSDIGLGNVENTAISTFGGSSNITTIGTVTSGDVSAVLPDGLVSGSSQIDHDQLTNFNSNEHFTQANITTVGTVTTGDVSAILPDGTVSGSSQIAINSTDGTLSVGKGGTGTNTFASGRVLIGNGTSAVQTRAIGISNDNIVEIDGTSNQPVTGDFAKFTANGLEGRSASELASDIGAITSADGVFSSSAQIDHDALTNFNSNEHFTQANITTVGTVTSGDVSAILPDGLVSESAQIDHDQLTNFVAAEHFTQASITTVGTVTSGDVSAILPNGVVSGSSQISIGSTDGAGNVVGLDVGISSNNVLQATNTGNTLVDNDFLRVAGTKIEGLTASQVKSALTLNNVENTAISTFGGSSNITTIGTVTSGDVSAILPDGLVSGSSQIDHDALTNFVAAEHFTQANITTVGTVTTGDVSAILPDGVVSGSSQINLGSATGTVDISSQTNLSGGTNLTLSGDTMNLDSNISVTDITATDITASGGELFAEMSNINGAGISIFGGTYPSVPSHIAPVGTAASIQFGTVSSGKIFQMLNNKISFDNDASNTFIMADTSTPENLEIHADGNIELRADNNLQVYSNSDFQGNRLTNVEVTASNVQIEELANAGTDTDKFLVADANGDVYFRTGANVLADIGAGTGTMSSFTLSADSGTNQTIGDGNTLEIAGGTGIDTVASSTDTVTISVDTAALTGFVQTTASIAQEVSRSFATGDTDSTALRIIGSGSVSGSGIFEIEGSVGTLFSVADGLDDVIFAANNISGLPVIEANADNTVRLGKFGGYGIVISGSTPNPTDTAANIIITGSIQHNGSYGLNTDASATLGRLDASNDIVAFSTSDKRLKENITPIENALEKVSKINGVEFDWKELSDDEKTYIHGNEGHDVGVIAQEIESVLPEVVTQRDNGYKAVKYEKIVPLLIEAIKELQDEIKQLKGE